MADYSRRVVYPKPRVEYYLSKPSNWAELSKMEAAVDNEVRDKEILPTDDTVTVNANDDEILMSFELPGTAPLTSAELAAAIRAAHAGVSPTAEDIADLLVRNFTVLRKVSR